MTKLEVLRKMVEDAKKRNGSLFEGPSASFTAMSHECMPALVELAESIRRGCGCGCPICQAFDFLHMGDAPNAPSKSA